jgi:PhnB protein
MPRIDTTDLTIMMLLKRLNDPHEAAERVAMVQQAKPVSEGSRALTPFLVVHDGTAAIEFYKQAFGAVEDTRLSLPNGKIGHAALSVGDARLMLSDEFDYSPCRSPRALAGTTVMIHLYVENVDAAVAKAIAAGATVTMPVADTLWGDRLGTVRDPFGHSWSIATHMRDMSQSEIEAALEAVLAKRPAG